MRSPDKCPEQRSAQEVQTSVQMRGSDQGTGLLLSRPRLTLGFAEHSKYIFPFWTPRKWAWWFTKGKQEVLHAVENAATCCSTDVTTRTIATETKTLTFYSSRVFIGISLLDISSLAPPMGETRPD